MRGQPALSRECNPKEWRSDHKDCPRWECAYKPGGTLVYDCECPCHAREGSAR